MQQSLCVLMSWRGVTFVQNWWRPALTGWLCLKALLPKLFWSSQEWILSTRSGAWELVGLNVFTSTYQPQMTMCQFFLVFSFIFPVYLLKNNLFLCQWGKTKSCLLSYGSHRWWDFGGSLCVATHSGKWKTRFSLNWLIPTFILSKMFHYRVSPPVLVFQADHLVRRGRPLVRHESVDHDIPEERISKRASAEILEAERLDDLEACMVSLVNKGVRGASADCIIVLFENWGISQLETAFLFNKSAHKHRNGKNSISAEHWICSKLPKTNLIYQYYIYWPA